MRDWATKLHGTTLRLAGILHAAEHTTRPWETPVSADTMSRAVEPARDYFLTHAVAAYGAMGAGPVTEAAQAVLRWVEDAGRGLFTKREAQHGVNAIREAGKADPALDLLTEHGYVRAVAGRRKDSRRYHVNPLNARGGRPKGGTVTTVTTVQRDPNTGLSFPPSSSVHSDSPEGRNTRNTSRGEAEQASATETEEGTAAADDGRCRSCTGPLIDAGAENPCPASDDLCGPCQLFRIKEALAKLSGSMPN